MSVQSIARNDETIEIKVSDLSGQKKLAVHNLGPDLTAGEIIQSLVPQMGLPRNGADGRPIVYHARLEREGRHLNFSETARDALKDGDEIVLHPNIDAGQAREMRAQRVR